VALPVVSVIIPCFNACATLNAAIESAISQDGIELEVIVVDDGSSDGSADIARGFAPRARVLTGPNRGVSAARNRGISEAQGKWFIFLDADDLLLPGTIRRRIADAAGQENSDVVVCDWQEMLTGSELIDAPIHRGDRAALEADAEVAIARGLWITTAALLYRKTIVEKVGGFRADLPIIQDARFLFDAAYHGARFLFSEHVGAVYRVQPDSLSRRNPDQFWRDVLVNGTQIESLWRARGVLTSRQIEALTAIYNHAVRGLFAAGSGEYFHALERQASLGSPIPLHSRVAAPLARLIGLRAARSLLSLADRR
jgi:glycosyltransferase involved in cell wall biosynthesis